MQYLTRHDYRLTLTRIRFRASDFGQDAKQISVQIRRGFWCEIGRGDGARVIIIFARVSKQLVFSENTATSTIAMSGAAKRRAECTSLGPGLKHPSLHRLTLAWPRKDMPRRFTCYGSSDPGTMTCCCCCCCVYSRMARSYERHALGALLFLVSRSEPASTDS